MDWKWVFDGIGGALIAAFVGVFCGYKLGVIKKSLIQKQKAGNNVTQQQTGNMHIINNNDKTNDNNKVNSPEQSQIVRNNLTPNQQKNQDYINEQSQKAGNNATQYQFVNIEQGIDEKRAREIYQENFKIAKRDFTQEACEIANNRINKFENQLMTRMTKIDGALNAFADPGFQILLKNAQITAAETERPKDYDLLSELLIRRFQKGKIRGVRAGINHAVSIVSEISDDALLGLTITSAVMRVSPVLGNVYAGLDVLDNLFGKLMYGDLPTGNNWLEHLDLLNAIRINSFGKLKKFKQYYSEQFFGYTAVGLKQGSENYNKAVELLETVGLRILVPHELNNGYVRIPISNFNTLDSLRINTPHVSSDNKLIMQSIPFTEKQKNVIKNIFSLYDKDPIQEEKVISQFIIEWDKRKNLKKLREWWECIPSLFSITPAGLVLAHANAKRCDSAIPEFNEF